MAVTERPSRWSLSRASERTIAAACALVALLIYALAARGHETAYDYFGRLAVALSQGRWWLDDAPEYLNELVGGVGGHIYSVVPPLPAILLVPFVRFAEPAILQQALSVVCASLAAAPTYLAVRGIGAPRTLALLVTALGTFGTTLWVSAVDGRSWYAADAVAVLFTSTALLIAVRRGPAWSLGLCLGMAFLARLPLVLAAPALLLITLEGPGTPSRMRATMMFALAFAPFALVEAVYNVARWGTPFDVGYAMLSHDDPYYAQGLFSLSYLPRHLYAIFVQAPDYAEASFFFLRAKSIGMSLVITTPAILWLARAAIIGRKAPFAGALALGCLAIVPDVLFGTVGFEQYGYRRSLDAQPFLLALLAIGGGWDGRAWLPGGTLLFRAAVVLSIAITAYFLVEIRLFGLA